MEVSTGTIVRTIVLIVTLVNEVLTATGCNPLPFSESEMYTLVSVFVTVGVAIWTWWKNNSFTDAAIKADEVMRTLKEEQNE